MPILQEIIGDCKTYLEFVGKNLWRPLIERLHCTKWKVGDEDCHPIGHGTRKRTPKDKNGDKITVPIKRFACKKHGGTLSFLPTFLLPRLHYFADVVNDVVERYVRGQDVPSIVRNSQSPDEKTARRWIERLTDSIKAIKNWAVKKQAADFHTFDERLVRDQQELYQSSERPPLLKRVWALLRALAIRKAEDRSPYHYLVLSMQGWVRPQRKPGST